MISRLARACFLGGARSTGWTSSDGAEPRPSQAAGVEAEEVGAQPFPSAQQFASINAADRDKMLLAIIVMTYQRCNQRHNEPEPVRFRKNGLQAPDLARVFFTRTCVRPASKTGLDFIRKRDS
jgi:hypothetical protein